MRYAVNTAVVNKTTNYAALTNGFCNVETTLAGLIEYVRRGAIEEVTSALASGRVVDEQFFLDNRTYEDAPCPTSTEQFAITCTSDATTYTITATGSGGMDSFIYTIDETDARTTAGPWGSGTCWITRKGDSC